MNCNLQHTRLWTVYHHGNRPTAGHLFSVLTDWLFHIPDVLVRSMRKRVVYSDLAMNLTRKHK